MPSLIRKRVSKATGKNSWHVQIPMGIGDDGRREYLRCTFDRRRDAKAYVEEKLDEGRRGGVIKPSEKILAGYLGEWLDASRPSLRENSAESYEQIIRDYLNPLLGTRRLADLQPLMIQRSYKQLLDKGLSPRTVRYAHSVLHNALDQAVRWRMLSTNPSKGVSLPKPRPTREMRPLNEEEAKRFLVAAQSDRLGAFFELALTSGMRPSELTALKWKDVDLDKGVVRVRYSLVRDRNGWRLREPKTKRGNRSIPIPPRTVEAIRGWKRRQAEERIKAGPKWQDHGFLFTTKLGSPLNSKNVYHRSLLAVSKTAGLIEEIPPPQPGRKPKVKPLISLYDLRHTCATLMLVAGVNPKVASERLGHASVVITLDTYSHVLPTMQEDATERLARILHE